VGVEVRGLVREGREGVVKYFGGESYTVDYGVEPLTEAFEGVSTVYHFAGATRAIRGVTFERDYPQIGRNVVEACVKAGVKKIVVNSDLGVARYGETVFTSNRYFWSRLILRRW